MEKSISSCFCHFFVHYYHKLLENLVNFHTKISKILFEVEGKMADLGEKQPFKFSTKPN
jgi:hypothetical protein